MKKFVVGMVIGTVVGTMFGMGLEAAGLARAVVYDGVDLNEVVWHGYEKKGKNDSDLVINSWRRKYSTPERRR